MLGEIVIPSLNINSTRNRFLGLLCAAITLLALSGCSGAPEAKTPSASAGRVNVVAAENFWASIVSQIGGEHVAVNALINSPDADPHDYEPTARDARAVAGAQFVIGNGAGYDPWLDNLISANPSSARRVLRVADLVGKKEGDNPHFWYNPDYVMAVVQRIHDDLKTLDPKNGKDYDGGQERFLSAGLQEYTGLIQEIKARYGGTKVGATESIFLYLGPALGLDVITPESYLDAVSEGQEVTAADEATVERQIDQKQMAILVYNSQNTPANIERIIQKAKAKGIPVATITETLTPATASFQEWQAKQFRDIRDALKLATGK